jgi:hypothetical protein
MLDEIRQQLINAGKNPEDYNIIITDTDISVTKKTKDQIIRELRERTQLIQMALDEIILGGVV